MAQITDRDLSLWIRGLACSFHMDDLVAGSGVSPLAIQKPHAGARAERVVGEIVKNLRYFRFGSLDFSGRDLVVTQHGVVPAVVNETFRI